MSISPECCEISVADLRKVIATLAKEVDLLWKLCGLLEGEQKALVQNNVDDLKASVEAQIALMKEIGALEDERQGLVRSTTGAGPDTKPVKLDTLIEAAPAEEAASLGTVQAALREVVVALGRVNTHNNLLIRQSLAYIEKALKLAAGEDTASAVYTPNGDLKCATGQIVVDRTV
ncbi:MAG TPA: flagellar protein FlgN [bacterium]|nr:flagellar protein FlgN [bacterium]